MLLTENLTSQVSEAFATLHQVSYPTSLAAVGILIFLWAAFRSVYLLYFHPLASFPGPRRAALSTWWLYSTSKTGRAEEIFDELHKKYNTRALRIAPNEIHITDTALYHTIYSQRYTYLKEKDFYDAFNTPHSVFSETDGDLHRQRRKLLNNFFSKTSVRSMESILSSKASTLCQRISNNKGNGPINFYQAFRCLTIDLITEVAFGESFGLITEAESNDFNAPILEALDLAAESLWDLMYFPIIRYIVNLAPPAIAAKLSKSAAQFQGLMQAVANTVDKFRRLRSSEKGVGHEIVFEKLADLNDAELKGEATDILVAGSDTTATTLSVALHEIIQRPAMFEKLRQELREAGIKTHQDCELRKIEQLPFLSACVKEALRCAMAVPGRLPRVVPQREVGVQPLMVDGKVVPSGAYVCMSAYTVHFDEDIWGTDAREFNPERWMTADGKHLEKYLVAFSKGVRACIGMNLAYAELELTLAMLVSQFRFKRDETLQESDMRPVQEFTLAFEGSGLRAYVQEDTD